MVPIVRCAFVVCSYCCRRSNGGDIDQHARRLTVQHAVERSSRQGAQRFEESLSWPSVPRARGFAAAERFDSAVANAEYAFLRAKHCVVAGIAVDKQDVLVADVQRSEVVEFVNVDEVAAIHSSAALPNVHDRASYRR